jgi:hypothetical protein
MSRILNWTSVGAVHFLLSLAYTVTFSSTAFAQAPTQKDRTMECVLHAGHEIDILETTGAKDGGEQGYKVVGQIPDKAVFPCYNFTFDGKLRIESKNGTERFVRLSPENMTIDNEFDIVPKVPPKVTADKPYALPNHQIYLDTVQNTVQLFKEPGQSWKNPTPENERLFLDRDSDGDAIDHKTKEKVALIAENSSYVQNYDDPVLHREVPKMFYYVAETPLNKVDDYLKGKNVEGVNKGWINSDLVRSDHISTNVAKEECPTTKPKTEITNQTGDLGVPIDKVTSTFEEKIAERSVSCPAKKGEVKKSPAERGDGKKIVDGHENLVHKFLHSLSKLFHSDKSVSASSYPTETQKKAIDILARSLYGEMRGCHFELGSRYSMAVARVAYNRATDCQSHDKCGYVDKKICAGEDFKDKKDGLSRAMIEALSMPSQFQAWDDADPNSALLMCIPEKDETDQKVFREDYKIATQVIMGSEKFLKETSSLAGVYNYGSGAAVPSGTCGRVSNVTVAGVPVDKVACFNAYRPCN